MKTRMQILVGVMLCCCLCASAKAETKETDAASLILSRFRDMLAKGKASLTLSHRAKLVKGKVKDQETVRGRLASIKEDGSWPDVNYQGRDRHDWETFYHIFILGDLTRAYIMEGPLKGDKELLKTILLAIDHWLEKNYQCPNSWYNTNAAPDHFVTIAVCINEHLTGDRRKGVMKIVGRHLQTRRRWPTAANLMDVAKTYIIMASLTGDTELLAEAARRVAGEIKIGAREGIQDDWSFHMHGNRHIPGYAHVYLASLSPMIDLLEGTKHEIPKEKLAIINDFKLNGLRWLARVPYSAPSVTDRQISWPGTLGPNADKRAKIKIMSKADRLVGFKHFRRSDLSIYHRPDFSFFIRTRSTRVLGTERINGQNRKGTPYLHTGDHYILRDTPAYADMPPLWDWSRLPGLTMFEGIGRIQPQPFVGGIGNGTSGMTAMDYKRTLGVRKLWAYHGDSVVCLLGGWQEANAKKGLRTTLDQCALVGKAQANVGGRISSLKTGTHELKDVRWVLHEKLGYVPLNPSAMTLKLGEVKGNWNSIDRACSKDTVKGDVFLCDMLHGDSPEATGYILAPGSTTKTLDKLAKSPPFTVVQNDRDLQCIRFKDGTSMAAFYTPGKVEINGKTVLSVDKPCLALWSGKELRLCDPTNPKQGVAVKVMWRGKTHSTTLPDGGKVGELMIAD